MVLCSKKTFIMLVLTCAALIPNTIWGAHRYPQAPVCAPPQPCMTIPIQPLQQGCGPLSAMPNCPPPCPPPTCGQNRGTGFNPLSTLFSVVTAPFRWIGGCFAGGSKCGPPPCIPPTCMPMMPPQCMPMGPVKCKPEGMSGRAAVYMPPMMR